MKITGHVSQHQDHDQYVASVFRIGSLRKHKSLSDQVLKISIKGSGLGILYSSEDSEMVLSLVPLDFLALLST